MLYILKNIIFPVIRSKYGSLTFNGEAPKRQSCRWTSTRPKNSNKYLFFKYISYDESGMVPVPRDYGAKLQ